MYLAHHELESVVVIVIVIIIIIVITTMTLDMISQHSTTSF